MRATDWSRVVSISHRTLSQLASSRLYLLVTPPRSERLRLPVHDFMALSPVDPLRKINNLAAVQFTTLFHGYTPWFDVGMETGGRDTPSRSAGSWRCHPLPVL